MRIPDGVSRVLAGSMFSMLLFSVAASRMEGQGLGRSAAVFNGPHFNAGIGAQARVRTMSPIVANVHPANPVLIKPFGNAMESRNLNDPLNNNPLLNPPGQHVNVAPGLQTQSPAARSLPMGPTVETATRTAIVGYSVPEVRQVQTTLRRLGYYRGDVDGDFGENTQNALERYQVSTGEPVTGTLSEGVLSRLGISTR